MKHDSAARKYFGPARAGTIMLPALVALNLVNLAIGDAEAASYGSVREARQIPTIESVSRQHGIDPLLVRAVVKVESNFNPTAVSHKGARGLMQLMPTTQRELGVRDAFDPYDNVDGGTRYLIGLIKRYDSVRKALWAYNAGPTRIDRKGPPSVSREYANQVLRIFWRLQADRKSTVQPTLVSR